MAQPDASREQYERKKGFIGKYLICTLFNCLFSYIFETSDGSGGGA